MSAPEQGAEGVGDELARLQAEHRRVVEEHRNCDQNLAQAYDELERTNRGVVALYAEIDEMNVRLSQLVTARARFMRTISHEFRTPVNSILGLTRLLLDPGQTDPLSAEQTEQVEFVRSSASDLLRLVEELMELARAESGRLQPVWGAVSLDDLVEELRGVVEPLLRDGVTLHVEHRGPGQVWSDPGLLRHVLRNLLGNAAKFTTEGHVTLVVEAAPGADLLELTVTDTGVGIAPEDLPRIFEEFYQAPSALQAHVRGTGLGLSFAQAAAAALGGHIEVDSQVGVGSTFRLSLRTDTGGADHA